MSVVIFILGILECSLLWFLYKVGLNLQDKAQRNRELAAYPPETGWLPCALIVPVGGSHPMLENAVRSLLEQDYPDYKVFLVTALPDEPCANLIDVLCGEYPHATHVTAGLSSKCGQKNYNLLAGINAAGEWPSVYAFCDSTHLAATDFLRNLLAPIAHGKAEFSTGYHQVQPKTGNIIALAYTLCVLFMRFLQGMSSLIQLWGGAMGMTCAAFKNYNVKSLWSENVVDDCSLSAYLHEKRIPIYLAPAALLTTAVNVHPLSTWKAWLERQILFLKFCIPGQWLGLCAVSFILIIPYIWCLCIIADGLLGFGGDTAPFLALLWIFFLAWVVCKWRSFVTIPVPPTYWTIALAYASVMFALVSFKTFFTDKMLWQRCIYKVGKGGKVIEKSGK